MPELPEVQTVATRLALAVSGATIERVDVRRRDVLKLDTGALDRELPGRRIAAVDRHGKRLLWRLDDGSTLAFHLGMTGNLAVCRPELPFAAHVHLVFRFADRTHEVRFRDPRRFGGVWTIRSERAPSPGGGRFSRELGPDALAIGLREFRRVVARPRRVKALLLDQSTLAGLGNIYVDEALHRAGIHPERVAATLDRGTVARLHRSIRRVLNEAIAAGGSSLRDYSDPEGRNGWFQVSHRVYGREGHPCKRCGERIVREPFASRSTHYCPGCQL